MRKVRWRASMTTLRPIWQFNPGFKELSCIKLRTELFTRTLPANKVVWHCSPTILWAVRALFLLSPPAREPTEARECTPSRSFPPPSAPSLYITYRQKYESNPPTSIKRHINKKICNLQSSPHPNYKPPVQIIISTYSIVHLTVSVHNNLYLNNKAHIILNCTHSCLIK